MRKTTVLGSLLLAGAVGCSDTPVAPHDVDDVTPRMHVGVPASSCPLAQLPEAAHVLLCFSTTLQPGVWHGWVIEVSTAQPPGVFNGNWDRTRLNHQYLLAAPEGFVQMGASDPITPPTPFESRYAFQAEFNGTIWWDVIRMHSAANLAPQTVPVVVYWLDATGAAGALTESVNTLLEAGVVNGGQATALTRKVDQALKLVAKGKTAEAIEVLEGFIQQANNLASDGVLTTGQAQALIAWVQYVIASLQ